MPNAEMARLIASLELKDQFTPGVNKALGGLGRLDAGITRSGGRAYRAGQQIGTGIKTGAVIAASGIAFLATQIGFGIRQLATLEKATAQTNAVLTSTKGVSGQTADSVRALAEEYENLNATIDDKVIQSGENLLLTFTNIRKEAFEPALRTALDLNTRLGGGEGGLQNTVKLLGKALNDPLKGLGALSKAGITFSKSQTDQIKSLVKNNDLLGAQNLILAELGKRYGGAFKAEGATAEGTLAGIGDAAEDLQKTLAIGLFPVVKRVLPEIRKALSSPELIKSVEDIGNAIASMFSDDNIRSGKEFLKGAFETAKSAAPIVAAAAKTTFGFVQAAVSLFKSLPAPLQGLLVGGFAVNKLTGGLVTNIAGGIIETVGKNFLQRGGTPANPLFVADVTGGLGKGIPAIAAGGAAAAALPLAVIGASIAGPIIAQQKISSDQQIIAYNLVTTKVNEQLSGGASLAQLQQSLAAVDKGILDIANNPLNMLVGGQALDELKAQRIALQGGVQQKLDEISLASRDTIGGIERLPTAAQSELQARRIEAAENRTGTVMDSTGKILGKQLGATVLAFRAATNQLRGAKGPAEIAAAVKSAMTSIFVKGQGGSGGAANVLSALKSQLKNTHDPKLASVLRAAIGKVEHKLAARRIVEAQLKKADDIYRSNRTNAQKIDALKQVQRDIGNRNVIATRRVQEKIDAAKRAQTAATNKTTAVLRSKDFSVAIANTIKVVAQVSSRQSSTVIARQNRYYNVPT